MHDLFCLLFTYFFVSEDGASIVFEKSLTPVSRKNWHNDVDTINVTQDRSEQTIKIYRLGYIAV
jgi:hypothetical protein